MVTEEFEKRGKWYEQATIEADDLSGMTLRPAS
jgi:hypothetical protein